MSGDTIVAVGADALTCDAAERIDCGGRVVMPGLINAHTHVPMTLLRGLADDLRLDVWLMGYMRNLFDSRSKIDRIHSPLLFLHGSDDEVVPIAEGRQLFDAARADKRFVEIHGVGHMNSSVTRTELLEFWKKTDA